MATKVLIDTNILIYAIDASSPFYNSSSQIFDKVESGEIAGFIAEKSLYELASVLGSPVFKNKISEDQIRKQLFYFIDNPAWTILYSNLNITKTTWRLFFSLSFRKNRIYDLVLLATALEYDLDCIYTKNTKDFENVGQIEIIDPTTQKISF